MGYESASKTVRGLSIATIVLSVLGIVLALVVGVFSNTLTNVVMDFVSDTPVAEDASAANNGAVEEVDDLYAVLGGDALQELATVFTECDVDGARTIGAAIAAGDAAAIEKAIGSAMGKESDLVDAEYLAEGLAALEPAAAAALGSGLQQITEEDLGLLVYELAVKGEYGPESFEGDFEEEFGISSETVSNITAVIWLVVWVLVVLEILGCAVTLVAGILGLRNAAKPEKLTGAFVWSIVGACVALLCCRIITMVLLIIACVYIHKVRSFRLQPAPAADQPFGDAPSLPEE